jgi:hypothetical protein
MEEKKKKNNFFFFPLHQLNYLESVREVLRKLKLLLSSNKKLS